MRKKLWILGLALLLLLTAACQKQPSIENPTEAPNITDPTVAADPTVATEPSQPTQVSEPTNPPSEPTEASTPPMLSSKYYPFCFRENEPMPDKGIDISGLQEGWVYSYDRETGKIYLIADLTRELGPGEWTTTYGYIHLISADRKEVIRCSYTGEDKTVVYKTENEITFLFYSEGERLLVTEENKRAILIEIPTGIKTVLVERDLVERAKYYPDSMNGKGPRVTWYGEPPGDGRARLFTYYLETGEIVEQHIL